jgi:creatinine amidohydrolase
MTSVLLEDSTRSEIRRAIAAGSLRAAIIPVASTEQHNEHLTMGHDARTVLWIARQVAERCRPAVVVTPVVNIGISEHWMDHPGTLTLSPSTFLRVVREVCDSLHRGGIRKVLVLNGHGGNRSALQGAERDFDFCSYWEAYTPETVARLLVSGECPGHAGEFETSTALAVFPESVRPRDEPYPDGEVRITRPKRAADDRRFFATVEHASAAKGRELLDIAVDWVERRVRGLLCDSNGC